MTKSPGDASKITSLHVLPTPGKASADRAPDTAGRNDPAPAAQGAAEQSAGQSAEAPFGAARVDPAATAAVLRRLTGSAATKPVPRSSVSPARPPAHPPAHPAAQQATGQQATGQQATGQQATGQPPVQLRARPDAGAAGAAPVPLRPPAIGTGGGPGPAAKPVPVLRPPASGAVPGAVPGAAPRPVGVPQAATVRPVAGPAELRPRHRGILISFVALVALPMVATASYLWLVAVDQYASTVGFSVRTEEISSSLDLLGGITRLSGGGSSDADILYDYIHSQELVERLNSEIDLRAVYAAAWPDDPVFAFDPSGTIEDLVDHWERKVRITYDSGSGLMTLRVLAFSAETATEIATRILARSTEKVNELSQDAREDATRYARDEMERALERLKDARENMTSFRMRTRVVDPVADLQGQMGILNSLQAQLAQSYVELDLLLAGTSSRSDPRITQIEQRIAVIQNRMMEERQKFGEDGQGPGGEDFATVVAEFERLSVDREFAEQAYRVALAAYDAALAEAQRKSRYLAAHIQPTRAERAEYPARWTLFGLTSFFLLMAWSIGVLIYYSIRDRR